MKYQNKIDNIYNLIVIALIAVCFISSGILIILNVINAIKNNETVTSFISGASALAGLGVLVSIYFIKINSLKK